MKRLTCMLLLLASGFAADKPHKLTDDQAKAAPQAQVVLHPRTNIYHCASVRVPFTVKDGKAMTQAEALKLGARPMRGMYCLEVK